MSDRIIYRMWTPPHTITVTDLQAASTTPATHTRPGELEESNLEESSLPVTQRSSVAPALKFLLHVSLTVLVHATTFFVLPLWCAPTSFHFLLAYSHAYRHVACCVFPARVHTHAVACSLACLPIHAQLLAIFGSD